LGEYVFVFNGGSSMQTTFPNPPRVCEKCGGDFEGAMFEVCNLSGQWAGRWNKLCRSCFHASGCKVGIGFGKMYLQNMYGEFVEVRGKVEIRNIFQSISP
jgi:hypothetical protein